MSVYYRRCDLITELAQAIECALGVKRTTFFKVGRVFAMLYTEYTGTTSTSPRDLDDAYTTVRFGESVYSQTRRFVVVSVRRNFVIAWFVQPSL